MSAPIAVEGLDVRDRPVDESLPRQDGLDTLGVRLAALKLDGVTAHDGVAAADEALLDAHPAVFPQLSAPDERVPEPITTEPQDADGHGHSESATMAALTIRPDINGYVDKVIEDGVTTDVKIARQVAFDRAVASEDRPLVESFLHDAAANREGLEYRGWNWQWNRHVRIEEAEGEAWQYIRPELYAEDPQMARSMALNHALNEGKQEIVGTILNNAKKFASSADYERLVRQSRLHEVLSRRRAEREPSVLFDDVPTEVFGEAAQNTLYEPRAPLVARDLVYYPDWDEQDTIPDSTDDEEYPYVDPLRWRLDDFFGGNTVDDREPYVYVSQRVGRWTRRTAVGLAVTVRDASGRWRRGYREGRRGDIPSSAPNWTGLRFVTRWTSNRDRRRANSEPPRYA